MSTLLRGFALVGLVLLACAASADPPDAPDLTLWIDGQSYETRLEINRRLPGAANARADVASRHYRGTVAADPDSWVRVSRLSGGWEGLAYVFGRMHLLGGGAGGSRVTPMSFSHQTMPSCGVDHVHGKTLIEPEALISPYTTQAVSAGYDALCEDQVAGACLMLELELAFDLAFQKAHPNDFRDHAASILNMVEGYYAGQFNMMFDTLSLTFPDADIFTTSTSAAALLGDVQTRIANDDITFQENTRALFHLVTGRRFDGHIAGLAYVGTLCDGRGYGSGVTSASEHSVTTAVVVAHELGHNLGAGHDDPDQAVCGGGFIMNPWAEPDATGFSSCSETEITETISGTNHLEQCFNFPVDAGIRAATGNPGQLLHDSAFVLYFDVDYQQAYRAADALAVAGVIEGEAARLQMVSADGKPCVIESDGRGFRCEDIGTDPLGARLVIEGESGTGTSVLLSQAVSVVSERGQVKDILLLNNTLNSELDVTAPPHPAPGTDAPEGEGGGGPAVASASPGGGSTGYGGLALVGALAAVRLLRRRRRV